MGVVPFSRWPLHNTSCVDALAVGPWRAGCAHATCAHATGRPLFSNCCACPAAQPHCQPAAKNHDAGNGFVGRQKEQVRTAYAVLWRLGFYFNRVHALFNFSCDIEVLNVDSRTRESCGVFRKIRQGVVNLCCSGAGWARSADKTMTHKLLEFFAVTKKIGCWPMLFPGESDGLNQKLLSKSKKATPPCIMCWLVGKSLSTGPKPTRCQGTTRA